MMREFGVMSEAAQATFSLKTEYSTPYGALIREDVVMGVSRYFIERWLPVLGTGPATVVNTLRQLDYHCRDGVVTISGETLAREAAMSRRYLYTCLDTPWMQAFIRLESGQRVRDNEGKIVQQTNRYHVRMDDPLTPADADHLLTILTDLADSPLEAVRLALASDARDLWASAPAQSAERFTKLRPITARDVLMRAFPTWKPANDEQKQEFAQMAETLHRHITLTREDGRVSKIIVPQYFRKRWWKHLGHDLAWSYLWLRGNVYDNPEEGIRRSTCWIPSLNTLLGVIGRPREWWRRNVENAKPQPNDWALSDFFHQIGSQKGHDSARPQWVARQYSVALDIPVAPEDRARYSGLIKTWNENPPFLADESPIISDISDTQTLANTESATLTHTGEEAVCHTHAHRQTQGLPHSCTQEEGRSATLTHTGKPRVCHIQTQVSATPAHRESESKTQALQKESKYDNSSKHHSANSSKSTKEEAGVAAAAGVATTLSLIDQIADTLDRAPETPLYRCIAPQIWLQETWPEPVRPHTPAWTLATSGQISPRDLVALILAIWADMSIKHPPRYLSWLAQRWQTLPEAPPVDQWDRWCALAELPLAEWIGEGRREWIELAPRDNRSLPFGLDSLADERLDTAAQSPNLPEEPILPSITDSFPEQPELNGLDERPGDGNLTIREIWLATLGRLSVQLNRSTYVNWVEGTKAVSYADGVLTVRARHIMAHDWLSERLNYSIEATASALAQRPITMRYIVEPPLRLSAELPPLE
jgi:hypothetical protein